MDLVIDLSEILFLIGLLFGGLLFWPFLRLVMNPADNRRKSLKTIFFTHIILLIISFALIYFSWVNGNQDWLHSLILPYSIGFLSVGASIFVILFLPSSIGGSLSGSDN